MPHWTDRLEIIQGDITDEAAQVALSAIGEDCSKTPRSNW